MSTIQQREVTPTDLVSLAIDLEEFQSWKSVDIRLALDAYSSVEFTAPFESGRAAFRETFRPFNYKPLDLKIDGETIFTGTVLGPVPDADANKSTVEVNGYSLPGVLQDCNEPASALPLEFKDQNLRDIATALLAPFRLEAEFEAEPGTAFDKVKLEVTGGVQAFLADLARQRNLVISNTAAGLVLFRQSAAAGRPVARLKDHQEPVLSVTPTFDPQGYYSEITGFVKPRKARKGVKGRKGAKFTAENPFAAFFRPMSFEVGDTEAGDVEAATNAKLGRMFANAASYSVSVATWRDPDGKLWEPNTTVTLDAPDAMVYRETEFLIRSVSLHQDSEMTTAQLGLVLPGAFSGEVPEELPWEE